jgi:hypothetical protein
MNRKTHAKVKSVRRANIRIGSVTLKSKIVVAYFLDEPKEKVKTSKTSHYLVKAITYKDGKRFDGISARFPKSISVKKEYDLTSAEQDAINDLGRTYLGSLKGRKGVVRRFDRTTGEGWITDPELDQVFPVYGCNIKGAKTGYSHTACVYLEAGAEVEYDFMDFGDHISAVNVTGPIHFDADKWNALDHDELAFKKDEDGNFINGLFAPSAGLW